MDAAQVASAVPISSAVPVSTGYAMEPYTVDPNAYAMQGMGKPPFICLSGGLDGPQTGP